METSRESKIAVEFDIVSAGAVEVKTALADNQSTRAGAMERRHETPCS
jgi:hypothetical protein